MKKTHWEPREETVFKPIGDIAKAIENTSLEDLILFMVVTSNAMKDKSVQGEPVVIGFND
jgi:hypothetical protein